MIYLDYAATTKVDDDVLEAFNKVCKNYYGNCYSVHEYGHTSNRLLEKATDSILETLNLNDFEIVYTSSSSESNNLALKGLLKSGASAITTPLEHSSVTKTLEAIDSVITKYVNLDEHGRVDLIDLEEKIEKNTKLVSVCYVDSELGIKQDIKSIYNICKKHNILLHIDATQVIGKCDFSFNDADLISISGHKFYAPLGIGILFKRKNIVLKPLIDGGVSHSKYRSSTVNLPGVISISKALKTAVSSEKHYRDYVQNLSNDLKKFLSEYDNVAINNTIYSIPSFINFSISNIKPEVLINALSSYEIYVSSKSTCSKESTSSSILSIYNDKKRASTSIRVTITYKTTIEEINEFKTVFKEVYNKLNLRS